MPKGENQKLKLMYLTDILKEKTDDQHGITMDEIIGELARCGVSAERKSIYDDIELLIQYGYDIVKDREGKHWKYYLASTTFELAELKLLVDAVQSSRFITEKKSRELINKLEGLTSHNQANKLQGQIVMAERIKNMNESIYYNVDAIHSAISSNRKICFMYYQWSGEKEFVPRHDGREYEESPWALMWDDENYYLVAYDSQSGEIRHYRVDRMQKISVIDIPREGKVIYEKADLSKYSRKMFGMFVGEEEHVSLLFGSELANVVIDKFGKDVTFYPVDEKHFKINVTVNVSGQFFGWLVGLGTQVKILSPGEVQNRFLNYLKEIHSKY